MTDLARVRAATASRSAAQAGWEAAQAEWVKALSEAVKTHTLQAVADAAGVTRGRVSQVVGPTGRSPGRPKRAETPS